MSYEPIRPGTTITARKAYVAQLRRRLRPWHVRAEIKTHRGMSCPRPPRARTAGEVWGIAMVRNEMDVLPRVLDHLWAQGVDRVLIADNGSTDGTLEHLRERAVSEPLSVAVDAEPGYFQGNKMTYLASRARSAGASWIVSFDADECWYAEGSSLAEALRCATADVLTASIHNVFPRRDGEIERLDRLDLTPHRDVKVAFRAHPLAMVLPGNHDVLRPGRVDDGLHVAHYPWRSREQLMGKVRRGAASLQHAGVEPGIGAHWTAMGGRDDDPLASVWDDLLAGRPVPEVGWSPVGPFAQVDVSTWRTWDPDGVVPARAAVPA